MTSVIPKYSRNLLFYGRQTDDILLIWHKPDHSIPFSDFLNDLNNVSNLIWTTTHLRKSVDFLDLTISIDNSNQIITKSYHKPMHLFTYLPSHSSHDPGVLKSQVYDLFKFYLTYLPSHSSHDPGALKSLVYGLSKSYLHQNTHRKDFLLNITKLHNRLIKQGYPSSTIKALITSCAQSVTTK